ncbi:fengycin family lipopeptide synthetase D [Croceifilum oryzae]|uniref:Fengycin family lipopeptide synthetase D n=1 Tax=Croceifilum oryzae TaxID=1553429 RepID=A0AAJ1THQ0_9BACL|nr:non-ribosomal peptide synthetase [Croceifilum oryzae]MDQ0416224.1 fengycin family lipopeptide synthetase D [Croceifilum oryzae]
MVDIQSMYPLSPMQQGMYFHALLDPESTAYFEQTIFTITGEFDAKCFADSFQQLVDRHDILRTIFIQEGTEEPVQVVLQGLHAPAEIKDITELSEDEQNEFLNQWIYEDRKKGFKLSEECLTRLMIFQTTPDQYRVIWSCHHLLIDGWCTPILLKEWIEIYDALRENRSANLSSTVPYQLYIEWLEQQDQEESLAFWKNSLAGYNEQVDLPQRSSWEEASQSSFKEITLVLDEATTKQLDMLSKSQQVTLNTALQGIWGILLGKYNQSQDVVFGNVVSGRPSEIPGVENIVGLFINTIPLRVQWEKEQNVLNFLQSLQKHAIQSQGYEYCSLANIQTQSELKQELIQHLWVFENYPMELGDKATANSLTIKDVVAFEETNYHLNLIVLPGSQLRIHFKFNENKYDPLMIEQVKKHLQALIHAVLQNPDQPISQLDFLTEADKKQLLVDFNATKSLFPKDKTIPQLFEEQVVQMPDQVAVVCKDQNLTFYELNQQAEKVAYLLAERGVGANQIIGLLVPPSIEMMIGLVGILKSGAAFLPIDPDTPMDRIEYMVQNSAVKQILTIADFYNRIPDTVEKIDLNKLWLEQSSNDHACALKIGESSDLAYVIYTSGTTGLPKGVQVTHRNVMNYIASVATQTSVSSADKSMLLSSYAFDLGYTPIFLTLLSGSQLYLVSREEYAEPEILLEYIRQSKITLIKLTPSLFSMMVGSVSFAKNNPCESIRQIILGGEEIKYSDVISYFKQNPSVHIMDEYGPTETTIGCISSMLAHNQIPNMQALPNIGRPIANTQVFIMNEDNGLLPIGVAGQLCIGGEGISAGYQNLPELTSEKFVANPFFPDERIYKTGDLARWLPDGTIEYLGRMDNQVKIRGYRIELGEVESQLLQISFIKEAVVIASTMDDGHKALCAYIVTEQELVTSELKASLAKTLPNYMIPNYFIKIKNIPLTANGKVDKKALPQHDVFNETGVEFVAPRTELEGNLVQIWQDVLGVRKISVYADFFELGGHSLKATTLVAKIHQVLNQMIPLRYVFTYPTIAAMACELERLEEKAFTAISPVEQSDHYPVSSAQKRIYLVQHLQDTNTSYNMPWAIKIEGPLQKDRFKKAWKAVIERHEMLRTSFAMEKGEIVQRIHDEMPFEVEESELNGAEIDSCMRSFIRPFDLGQAPLIRVGLVNLGSNGYVMLCDMHHIIADGVSLEILLEEWMIFYTEGTLPEQRIQYKDFAAWQNSSFNSEEYQARQEFWLNQFQTIPPVLSLPTDYTRSAVQSFGGDRFHLTLDSGLTEKLYRLARETGTTLYMVLLASYQVLLHKYTGQEDIVVGTPTAGRPHAEVESMIGMFVNMLAMRNYPEGQKTLRLFLEEVKHNALKAYENQDYPFEQLVEQLEIQRELSRHPLFDTLMVLQNTGSKKLDLPSLHCTPLDFPFEIAKFDLTLEIAENENEIVCDWEYSTSLFKRETIERMATHWIKVLHQFVENVDQEIGDVECLSEAEKHRILVEWNDTKSEYPYEKTIQQLFEEQVEKTPNRIAIQFGNQKISYLELNETANRWARVLRKQGVTRESRVGFITDRSSEMIIGLLSILKAGGSYVPIDPSYPEDRKQYILEDSKASILMVQDVSMIPDGYVGEVLVLAEMDQIDEESSNLEPISLAENVAYIVYTSGSTGKPKGILTTHRNIVKTILNNGYIDIHESDRILQLSNYAFDGSTFDIYGALLHGAGLVLASKEVATNPDALASFIQDEKITVSFMTTALFNTLVDLNSVCLLGVRKILFGGEKVSVKHVQKALEVLGDGRLIHVYGPTETTVFATYYVIDQSVLETGMVPIGKPLNNTQVYVLDQNHGVQPIGVPGELCIAGDGVASGYLNRPELTAASFIENPFSEGKMYRTGDLVRLLPDGNIEYLERLDHQVKIRGYRIELGEIQEQLIQIPIVKDAIAIATEMENSHHKELCAYIVANEELTTAQLRFELAKSLPSYMIPSYFVQMDYLPLTPNGKVDRKALPAPTGEMKSGYDYVAPRNLLEEMLVDIWQEVLKVDRVGVEDDFFELGGHSLKATQLVALIYKKLNVNIPIHHIFQAPTIDALAKILEEMEKGTYTSISSVPKMEYYPVSSAQKRMYLLRELEKEALNYNMPWAYLLEGVLDTEKMLEAWKTVVNRHEALRTSFGLHKGEIVQLIDDTISFEVERYQIESEAEIQATIDQFIRPFDLSKAPLLRVGLIKVSENKHVLMMDMHHIISDGTSVDILVRELISSYSSQTLDEVGIQYKDYAVWQNTFQQSEAFKAQETYWKEIFQTMPEALQLPTDSSRPAVPSFAGDHHSFILDPELSCRLNQLSKETGTSLYMLLLAAYNVLLHKYTGESDIVVGSPIAGRSHPDVQSVVGMFVNTLAMRNHPEGHKSFRTFLNEVRESSLGAFDNQDYPFEKLVEGLDMTRDLSRHPLFDTMFLFQNMDWTELELPNLQIHPYDLESQIAKLDLMLEVMEQGEEIKFHWEYSTALFKPETIIRMSEHWKHLLHQIVESPDQPIAEFRMVTEPEAHQLLVEFNDTSQDYPEDKTVHQLFEEQVMRTPDNVALIYKEQTLTYRDVNVRANKLAKKLQSLGVRSESLVAMMVERSPEMMIGILAILKSGGAYVPIDPDYPEDRIQYMLQDSGSDILLTQRKLVDLVDMPHVLCIDEEDSYQDGYGSENLDIHVDPKQLAYVIYTSGSTGMPKGVMIEHQSVVSRLHWMQTEYPLTESDVVLQKTLFSFDLSVWEIFSWFMGGSSLCLLPTKMEKDPEMVVQAIEKYRVTSMYFVPSMLSIILHHIDRQSRKVDLSSVKRIFTCGEVLSAEQVKSFYQTFQFEQAKLINMYGPTEATVNVTVYDCYPDDEQTMIPIGVPIHNAKLYIVNEHHQPQPVGVIGELCIGGIGIARGYHGKQELTDEKFVANPFSSGEKMYKTGDLARYLPDGNMEYIGRTDHQVKVRGFRIELGEIESQLLQISIVREAVVITRPNLQGQLELCAYFVAEQECSVSDLRAELSQVLPHYMVPSYLVQLENMPLTPNGKVDRKTLPAPEGLQKTAMEYMAPRNELERKLVTIWSEVLGVEQVGIDDRFFEMGGNSLKILEVGYRVNELYQSMHLSIPLSFFYENQTIRSICHQLSEMLSLVSQPSVMNLLNAKGQKNVFGFPPIFGYGIVYKPLAEQMDGEMSLYVADFIESDDRIERYVESITEIQPAGPITLMGYSAGGNLAFEVAKALEKRGREVSQMILLDSIRKESHLEGKRLEEENMEDITRVIGETTDLSMLSQKYRAYVSYFLSLVNDGNIHGEIHQILAHVDPTDTMHDFTSWSTATEHYRINQGYGTHFEMMSHPNVEKNAILLREILKELRVLVAH